MSHSKPRTHSVSLILRSFTVSLLVNDRGDISKVGPYLGSPGMMNRVFLLDFVHHSILKLAARVNVGSVVSKAVCYLYRVCLIVATKKNQYYRILLPS